MAQHDYPALASALAALLKLQSPPLAITFSDRAPPSVQPFEGDMPAPTADGRTGRVSAGCVFWMKATQRTFTTVPEDHRNCSVGSLTHGLKALEEAAVGADVAALVESGWVAEDVFAHIPVIQPRPSYITYGPLAETPVEPDVVFMRLNAKQVMILCDALPELSFEGKPQCHIIPLAKEHNEVAVSVGCMLSRVRTGMTNNEMTCALPAKRLPEVIERLEATCTTDSTVAEYASEDARRFRV
ncbi:MAG: DUF169 domain-containing protein [Acidiferrobacterales bacterium]